MYAMKVDDAQAMHWTEVPDPVPKEGEVLLKIRAAALNRADLLQRAGKYPPPPGWPEWMGLEVAGVVLSAPAGSRWKAGDEVCALLGGGGYAEKIAVPEGMVLPVPAGLSMAEAASLPEVFATAYLNLFLEAHMREGETVFVQAGASGLGLAAIQLAKAFGAKVMTSVGSPEKAEAVRRIGADWVLERRRAPAELAGRSLIVGLGRSACADLMGIKPPMSEIANVMTTVRICGEDIDFLPTYHPAACIYRKEARERLAEA